MALSFEAKKSVVKQVNSIAVKSISVGIAENHKLSVAQMSYLRNLARNNGVIIQVVKNTLAKRAIKGTQCECIIDTLIGSTLLGFSDEDPGAVARVFKNFAKEGNSLSVKGFGISGDFFDGSELDRVASLPTKDQAISQVMATLLAPTEKLARTLNEIPTKITRVVLAIRESKS